MPGLTDAITRVCVAGATGWTGQAICAGILDADADDLELVGAVARSAVGHDLGEALGRAPLGLHISLEVAHAIASADVLVDYTSSHAAREHALTAIENGVHVVIGTWALGGRLRRPRRRRTRARRGRRRVRQLLAHRGDGLGRRPAPRRLIAPSLCAERTQQRSGTMRAWRRAR